MRAADSTARDRGFARTLAFGAIAGLAAPTALLVLGPFFGGRATVEVVWLGAAAGYLLILAPALRTRLVVALGATTAAVAVLALSSSAAQAATFAALIVAAGRSLLFERSQPLRALAVEGVVAAGALFAAKLVGGPGLIGVGLGVWAFFLVQSAFFLVPGLARRRAAVEGDPFDRARERLLALLDQTTL
jgi:hypothetical protein